MSERAGQIFDLIRGVIADPTSNLTVAVLLMAMLIIIVLIISAVIYLLLVLGTGKEPAPGGVGPEEESEGDTDVRGVSAAERSSSRPRGDRRYVITGILIFLAAVALTYGLTGTDSFCARACHANSTAVETAGEDAHVSVSCASCHGSGSLVGIAANVSRRLGCLGAQLTGGTVTHRPVRAERCLECHENILGQVLVDEARGLRMAHTSPIEAGMSCEDCHADAGHGTVLTAGMNPCLRCHDGEAASAECSTCHLDDPSQASVSDRPFPKVRVANRDCGACHDLAPCDECHGTRMPHSETFIAYAHAKEAAFERKESCYLCHEESDCGHCHGAWDSGHGATVVQRVNDHVAKLSRSQLGDGAVCACHNHGNYRNYCAICHEEAGSVF